MLGSLRRDYLPCGRVAGACVVVSRPSGLCAAQHGCSARYLGAMRSKPGRLWLLAASLLGMAAEAASPLSSFRSLLPSDCCFAPSAKQQLTLAVRAWHAREYRLALCCAGEVIRASSPGHTGSAGDVPPASLESIPCIRPAHRNCTRAASQRQHRGWWQLPALSGWGSRQKPPASMRRWIVRWVRIRVLGVGSTSGPSSRARASWMETPWR